jgi:class 3 adenylate cyclase/tetratricopeptide (TPR) repeat protein
MDACSACGAVLPPAARFCPSCAAPIETAPDQSERKLATIIFADLVGSTALAGSQDPERTRAVLERFYDAMAQEIEAAGGTVEKFAGDAVMAAFGAPASLEDHAERALHAALAMQRRLEELFGETLSLRIGVNTGDVVAGKPREGSSFVTGDPVNVAARLEQAAEPGDVLVGERTVAAVRGAFEFAEPQTIEAKGKPEGVVCRRLLRALSLMRPRGVSGLGRAFVGRDEEMRSLEHAYDQVTSLGEPRLVTILGDAGVGKTRLVREFWEHLGARSPEPFRRTGRCLSYGEGVAYWPLAEVLKEHLQILESDPPSVALERLGSREILGLTFGLDVAQDLHPLAARDRFQDAWVDFLGEVASERTTVLLIEDTHWGEEPLLDLLERLLRDVTGPLLLIATARPEFLEARPGWGARIAGETLDLEALSTDDAAGMLDGLLGGSLPPGLREVVVQRAEGNPFFVEEVLGTLLDRGLLARDNGSWTLAELPSDFSVPDTIQAVLAARIDLLEPAEKHALQAASVIGRIFWAGPVYDLVDDAEPDLTILEERDLIRRRSGSAIEGDREYAVKHALTREVAYASLPKARRARMHASFARWLERTVGASDEHASVLAHHLAAAVAPEDADLAWLGDEATLEALRADALTWLGRAAELSIGRMEIDDGLSLLHRALELEADDERRASLWQLIGRANILKFDGEGFRVAMLEALSSSDDRGLDADLFAELGFQASLRGGMWKRRLDADLVEGWIDRALELAAPGTPARARALMAQSFEDPLVSSDLVEEACEIADRLDDLELRSFGLEARSELAFARGDYDEAVVWTRRRLELVPAFTDPDHLAQIYGDARMVLIAGGKLDEALEFARLNDGVTSNLSPHHRLHAAWAFMHLDLETGRWDAIRELTPHAEAVVAANLSTPCVLGAKTLLTCALARVHLGDEAEARRLEGQAADLGFEGYAVMLSPMETQIAVARGDLAAVARIFETWKPDGFDDIDGLVARLEGLVLLGRRAEIEEEAPALVKPGAYVEPFALRALGLGREDDDLLAQAIARFDSMGMEWHAAETRELMARA